MALFPALVTFAVIPFGDVLVIGERMINLQVANINIGILYVFSHGLTRCLRHCHRRLGVKQ